ncbi:IRK-interacting protein [Prunus yedoensis var. nudiflora]|uniref:IRK-interacting protein n=1 Tax=Prunus yedoensis var. nudiflora TaxID=2094558 RepID=A0A314ZIR9_PRUYE|nr:IRK-interacting protein [Prunus yedoensis var. nudiflora]
MKQEIQTGIAKAEELRALHAALVQGSSPANLRLPSSSPASHRASQFSAQDYPVFTLSYEDEPLPGYHQVPTTNRTLSESWDEYGLEEGNGGDEAVLSSYKDNSSSTKGFPSDLANLESHALPS